MATDTHNRPIISWSNISTDTLLLPSTIRARAIIENKRSIQRVMATVCMVLPLFSGEENKQMNSKDPVNEEPTTTTAEDFNEYKRSDAAVVMMGFLRWWWWYRPWRCGNPKGVFICLHMEKNSHPPLSLFINIYKPLQQRRDVTSTV